ncbi:uncharacterized protein M6B38_309930 [Iris pallida]|uniref:Uncharacterized protein n=1 Tax=Iris pallida TaxID=29817 RepID=A0AAX6HIE7_IRIPA|nr:uncharacterized protein M6B38_309930 [Iris pallida]
MKIFFEGLNLYYLWISDQCRIKCILSTKIVSLCLLLKCSYVPNSNTN